MGSLTETKQISSSSHLILVTHGKDAAQCTYAQLLQLPLPIQGMGVKQRLHRIDDCLDSIGKDLASEDELARGALHAGLYLPVAGHDGLHQLQASQAKCQCCAG